MDSFKSSEADPNLIAVRFHPTTSRSLRANIISSAGMTTPPSAQFDIPEEGIVLVSPAASTSAVPGITRNQSSRSASESRAGPWQRNTVLKKRSRGSRR